MSFLKYLLGKLCGITNHLYEFARNINNQEQVFGQSLRSLSERLLMSVIFKCIFIGFLITVNKISISIFFDQIYFGGLRKAGKENRARGGGGPRKVSCLAFAFRS